MWNMENKVGEETEDVDVEVKTAAVVVYKEFEC